MSEIDGSLSNACVYENGAAEKSEVEYKEMSKGDLGDIVHMPLLWD